ncbi:MAG: acyl-CoA dehydrogenase, partial [Pseudomonas sp.]
IDEALLAGPTHWAQIWQRDQGVMALAAAAREKRLAKAWAAAGLS